MTDNKRSFFYFVDSVTDKAGQGASYLVLLIMTITTIDVVARYAFNHPLLWGWMTNRQLFGVFILFAGAYTMFKQEHIRIEIFYDLFPKKVKVFAKVITLLSFISFMGVLIWQSAWMGWNSMMMGEKASGAFRIPMYPFKLLIPVAASLFFLQGISVFTRFFRK